MSYQTEFDALLNQLFTSQSRPADSDPDTWVEEAGGWSDAATVYGHLNPGNIVIPTENVEGAGRDTGVITQTIYLRPTAFNSAGSQVTTESVCSRKHRLIGPAPATRIFSIRTMVGRYDDSGLHHWQLVVSEVVL